MSLIVTSTNVGKVSIGLNLSSSRKLYESYSKVTPGGVQSNFRFEEPHPLYFRRASGSRMWDIDGNEYTDYVVGYGSIILGHNDPKVRESVTECLETGLTSGVETELSYRVCESLCNMIPTAESARVAVTGTEAVMHAIMLARAYSGKKRIVKVEGTYHGWYDPIAVSHYPPIDRAGPSSSPTPVPNSAGLDSSATESTLMVQFNDVNSLVQVVNQHKNEIAALIIEPVCFNMGAVMPKSEYLQEAREITSSNDIPLIFDEVITGFRLAPGGAQEYFHISPDMSTFGKALGNGYPISALVGRSDILEMSKPGGNVAYSGTYSGNQISLAAAKATLDILKTGNVQRHLHTQTDLLISSVEKLALDSHIPVRVQGVGGQFQIYFSKNEVKDYRSATQVNAKMYKDIRNDMKENRLLFHPHPLFHHGVTGAHTSEDLDHLIQTIASFLSNQSRASPKGNA